MCTLPNERHPRPQLQSSPYSPQLEKSLCNSVKTAHPKTQFPNNLKFNQPCAHVLWFWRGRGRRGQYLQDRSPEAGLLGQEYGQARSRQMQPNAKAHSARSLPSCRPSNGRGASSLPRLLPAEGVVRISASPGRGGPAKPHLCVSDLLTRLRNCPASCFAHELSPLTSLAHFLGATGLFRLCFRKALCLRDINPVAVLQSFLGLPPLSLCLMSWWCARTPFPSHSNASLMRWL